MRLSTGILSQHPVCLAQGLPEVSLHNRPALELAFKVGCWNIRYVRRIGTLQTRPWYLAKVNPSFQDALAALRRVHHEQLTRLDLHPLNCSLVGCSSQTNRLSAVAGCTRRRYFHVCCWCTCQRGFSGAGSLAQRVISSLTLAIPSTASVSIRFCSLRKPARRTRLQI